MNIDKRMALNYLTDFEQTVLSMRIALQNWNFSYTSGLEYSGVNNLYRQLGDMLVQINDTKEGIKRAQPRKSCTHQIIDEAGVYCGLLEKQGKIKECTYDTVTTMCRIQKQALENDTECLGIDEE